MRIGIVGAGAMGGFYGARLARTGYDVRFLMRTDYEKVRRDGLTVLSPWGDFRLEKVNCYAHPEEMGPVDLVFVALKATANGHYGELIGPLVGPETRILTAQNGLGNEEQLAQLFPADQIAGGLAFICVNREGKGVIRHLDYGYIHIGNYRRAPDDRIRQFGEMMVHSGVKCTVVDDLTLARWEKLVWNVPFNGLSAALDKTVDQIVGDDKLRARAEQLMKEVQAAARACGVLVEDAFLDTMMDYSLNMTPYFTSMHLDRRNGRPMEIEAVVGEPLRQGKANGVALPGMEELYEQVKAIEADRAND